MTGSSFDLLERLGVRICFSLDGAGGVGGDMGGGMDAGGMGDVGGMGADMGAGDFGGAMDAAGAEMGGMSSGMDMGGMDMGGMADPGMGGYGDMGLGEYGDVGMADPGLGGFADPGMDPGFADFGFGAPAGLADLGFADPSLGPALGAPATGAFGADAMAAVGFAGFAELNAVADPLGPAMDPSIAAQFGLEPALAAPSVPGFMEPFGAAYQMAMTSAPLGLDPSLSPSLVQQAQIAELVASWSTAVNGKLTNQCVYDLGHGVMVQSSLGRACPPALSIDSSIIQGGTMLNDNRPR